MLSYKTIACSITIIGSLIIGIGPAKAHLIFEGPFDIKGFGFGNNPRALTVQSHSPRQTTESGCIAPDGGVGLVSGNTACANTAVNVGGDEAPPIGFPKQSAPTLASLGITSGSQLGILFDAIQPQNSNNNVISIGNLTLKLYSGSILLFTASGIFPNLTINPGNGNSDYLFGLDSIEAAQFDVALSGNTSDRIALDSTINFPNQSAGPDSYTFINNGAVLSSVPEPASFVFMCIGLIGLGLIMVKRRSNIS